MASTQPDAKSLLGAAREAFSKLGWAFREIPKHRVIEADVEAYHGRLKVHVQTFENVPVVHVVATSSLQIPRGARNKLAELFMRSNRDLSVGNFEMDWDEGMVMFRIDNVFPTLQGVAEAISSMAHSAVVELDRITGPVGIIIQTPSNRQELIHVPGLLDREDLLPPMPKEAIQKPSAEF